MTNPVSPPAPEEPKKKGKAGKIILIIAILLVVVCGGGGFLAFKLLGKAVDAAYAEGKCVDSAPNGTTAQTVIPKPVDCTDAKAVAKIIKVADGKGQADAEAVCGTVTGADRFLVITLTDGKTKLLCLGPK